MRSLSISNNTDYVTIEPININIGCILHRQSCIWFRRIDSYGIDSSLVMHQDLCVYLWCGDKWYTFLDKA